MLASRLITRKTVYYSYACAGRFIFQLVTAGRSLQEECNNYVRRHGKVLPGNVAVTKAGNLSAKYVIHAVGPVWNKGGSGEVNALHDAIYNCLFEATKLQMTSVGIPAISSGQYRFPLDQCTKTIMDAIKDYLKGPDASGVLKLVKLIDTGPKTVAAFQRAAEYVFRRSTAHIPSTPSSDHRGAYLRGLSETTVQRTVR